MANRAATNKQDSFLQSLGNLLGDVGALMQFPDADIAWCQKLQLAIATKIREGTGAVKSPGAGAMGSAQGMGQPSPGAAMGGPAGQGPQMGQPQMGQPALAGPPGVNGVSNLSQAPNPDELRRMLAGLGGAGAQ